MYTSIISQICGIIVCIAAIVSMQLKNVKYILVCQLICNGLGALSYVLDGGFTGCGIYLIAILQSVVYYLLRQKQKNTPALLSVCFGVAYLICSLVLFKDYRDMFSMVAALTCAAALSQSKSSMYRFFMLLNGAIWLTYDVTIGASLGMAVSHIVTTLSAAVGIIRLDIKRNKK